MELALLVMCSSTFLCSHLLFLRLAFTVFCHLMRTDHLHNYLINQNEAGNVVLGILNTFFSQPGEMESSEEGGLSVGGEENYFQGYTFTDRSHSSRVVKSIMDLCLEDGLFADVTITVDGKEFHLHRLVLSAQSSFFRSMFTSNLKESHNRCIELKDVSAAVFQLLVDYIYHGTIKLRVEELQDTYEMADMYQLTALFEECSRFLSRTVEVKNCLQVCWCSARVVIGA